MTHRHPDRQARARDDRSIERTTRVPTRLGGVHVRTMGEGAPTVLWPSMFVDSHTLGPVDAAAAAGAPVSCWSIRRGWG